MRFISFGVAIAAAGLLAGCGDSAEQPRSVQQGRYLGVGIYSPGTMWPRMVTASAPSDKARATIADDEQVIVTVDSRTGELRQCGNISGYCISMDPWRQPVGQGQSTPLSVTEHLADIEARQQEELNEAATTAPAR